MLQSFRTALKVLSSRYTRKYGKKQSQKPFNQKNPTAIKNSRHTQLALVCPGTAAVA